MDGTQYSHKVLLSGQKREGRRSGTCLKTDPPQSLGHLDGEILEGELSHCRRSSSDRFIICRRRSDDIRGAGEIGQLQCIDVC